jgi:hypothetical protein
MAPISGTALGIVRLEKRAKWLERVTQLRVRRA